MDSFGRAFRLEIEPESALACKAALWSIDAVKTSCKDGIRPSVDGCVIGGPFGPTVGPTVCLKSHSSVIVQQPARVAAICTATAYGAAASLNLSPLSFDTNPISPSGLD